MIRLRAMRAADLPLGMQLKQQAGWNQTEADWKRFMALAPDGCFVAELEERAAGTVTTCTFGEVGWVAMLLVAEHTRGRGVGSALMTRAIEHLERQGVSSIRLDATELGQPIYEKLGFRADSLLVRHGGVLQARPGTSGCSPIDQSQLRELAGLDRQAAAVDRTRLLAHLMNERSASSFGVCERGRLVGYVMTRPGSRARQIGPAVALLPALGRSLVDQIAQAHAGEWIYVDVPEANASATAWLRQTGLRPQRQLLRMTRGRPIAERADLLWASSGPETG